MGKLEGKVALITGAGSGIGRATARLFAQEGAKVAVVDCVRESGEATARMVEDDGGAAVFVEADVSRADDVERMVAATVKEFGRVDILYNNAGTRGRRGLTADLTEEDWDVVLDTNLKSVFLGSKYVIPLMLEQGGGVIISTSSTQGLNGNRSIGPYCASKGGVVLLTKTMAVEYGRRNIRVNCICPGTIETPMTEAILPFVMTERMPAGRAGQADEIARAALFLASDDSSFVNGVALVVDGGWMAEIPLPRRESPAGR